MTTKLAVFIRHGRVLVDEAGNLPTLPGNGDHPLPEPVEKFETSAFTVVTVSAGEPPDGYSWVRPVTVQDGLDYETSERFAEVMLCVSSL